MSDYLMIRGIAAEPANTLLAEWARTRQWAREAGVRRAWEPLELFINGRNAIKFIRGKHKQELAELVLSLQNHGGSVIHVILRDDQRLEVDLRDWAARVRNRDSHDID